MKMREQGGMSSIYIQPPSFSPSSNVVPLYPSAQVWVCCSLGLFWLLFWILFNSLLPWIVHSRIWYFLLPLLTSLFIFLGCFLRTDIWDVACLNISLSYFYAWLKMCLGVEFAKMKILFNRISKVFFHIMCEGALVKGVLCVHQIYFIFFVGKTASFLSLVCS